MSIVAQHFTDAQLAAAAETPIQANRFRLKNDAVVRLDQSHDISDDTVRGVTIVGSPLTELNGTYLEAGSSDGVPMYVHVRKWCLLRIVLPELPELGISVAVSKLLSS